ARIVSGNTTCAARAPKAQVSAGTCLSSDCSGTSSVMFREPAALHSARVKFDADGAAMNPLGTTARSKKAARAKQIKIRQGRLRGGFAESRILGMRRILVHKASGIVGIW